LAVSAVALGQIGNEQIDKRVIELRGDQQSDFLDTPVFDKVFMNQKSPRRFQGADALPGDRPVRFRWGG